MFNNMSRLEEVKRITIPITGPFDYRAAKAEVDDAIARGDEVVLEGRDLVVRTLAQATHETEASAPAA